MPNEIKTTTDDKAATEEGSSLERLVSGQPLEWKDEVNQFLAEHGSPPEVCAEMELQYMHRKEAEAHLKKVISGVELAIKYLWTISSEDGSGHRDLALAVSRASGVPVPND